MSAAASMPPAGSRRGFTIIELFTVIGVITVLTSILVPVVSRARKSSMGVQCAANLRQVSHAVLLYALDNDGQLPNPNWDSTVDVTSSSVYGVGWLFAVLDYRGNVSWLALPQPPQDGVKTGVLWPYLGTTKVYHCPMDDPDFRTGTEFLTSYMMDGSSGGFGRLGTYNPGDPTQVNIPAVRLTRMPSPSQSVMLWEALEQRYQGESNTGCVWNDGASYPNEEVMADRHSKGANISCYDGHVEWWDNGTWKYWVNQPGIGRLWWDPLSTDGR